MPKKIEVGDEDDEWLRVRFPGYRYPITINPDAIEKVVKPPKPKFRRLRDISD